MLEPTKEIISTMTTNKKENLRGLYFDIEFMKLKKDKYVKEYGPIEKLQATEDKLQEEYKPNVEKKEKIIQDGQLIKNTIRKIENDLEILRNNTDKHGIKDKITEEENKVKELNDKLDVLKKDLESVDHIIEGQVKEIKEVNAQIARISTVEKKITEYTYLAGDLIDYIKMIEAPSDEVIKLIDKIF